MLEINHIRKTLDCGMTCEFVSEETEHIQLALTIQYGAIMDLEKGGVAHFLEHMLLEFDKSMIDFRNPYSLLGKTNLNYTVYIIECNKVDLEESLCVIKAIVDGVNIKKKLMEKVRKDILNEYKSISRKDSFHMYKSLFKKNNIKYPMPVGKLEEIHNITFNDICGAFRDNYTLKNMRLLLIGIQDVKLVNEIFNTEHINHKSNSSMRFNTLSNFEINSEYTDDYFILFLRSKVKRDGITSMHYDLLESLAMTFIEEILFEEMDISENHIFSSSLKVDRNIRFMRIMIKALKDDQIEIISELKKCFVVYNDYNTTINNIKNEYKKYLQNEKFDTHQYMKHMIECYIYGFEMYNNNMLIKELSTIKAEEIYLFCKAVIHSKGYMQFKIRM